MNQKTRNKIAWVIIIMLSPVLLYLVVRNVSKAKERKTTPPDTGNAITAVKPVSALPSSVSPKVSGASKTKVINAEILAEQKRIAAFLPKHNPFSASKRSRSARTSVSTINEHNIRVTGIVSRIAPAQSMAVINGQILKKGDRIETWKVIQINDSNVVLDNGTKQITVEVE
ncbi:hypothetical protein ACFLS1_09775 [Verrucomicrobiota bacterium]